MLISYVDDESTFKIMPETDPLLFTYPELDTLPFALLKAAEH